MLKIANKFGGHGVLTDFEVSLMYEFSVWLSIQINRRVISITVIFLKIFF